MEERDKILMQALEKVNPAEATFKRIFEERAEQNGEKALLTYRGLDISYREVNERANRLAHGLKSLGVKKGDKVCVMLPNCPEIVYTWMGLCKMGAVNVPLNTGLKGEGLSYIINHSDAETVIISHRYLDPYMEVAGELKNIKRLIVEPTEAGDDFRLPEDSISFQSFLKGEKGNPVVEITPDDYESIMYTSGTTGLPKGVHYQQSRAIGSLLLNEVLGIRKGDTCYTCLPFFHISGQGCFWMSVCAGGRLGLGERFSASRFWSETKAQGARWTMTLGAMIPILCNQPARGEDADNPVELVISAAAPKNFWKDFEERFKVKILELYAQTEGGFLLNYRGGRVGAMGRPALIWDMRVFDEADNALGPGSVGELVGKPTNPSLRLYEYYKNPEATAAKTKGGWLRTGDLAYFDEEGYFFFVDRKNDCMRRRGENISSYEVEKVVNKHPQVLESAAYGVPSELAEDDVMICVVAKPGERINPEELIGYCAQNMPYYMVPRYVRFAEELEKTGTQRVRKFKLKEEGVTSDTWDREKTGYDLKKQY